MSDIEISVVIPVRNGEKLIGDQLKALAAQDVDVPWEIIVVDDASTDRTREIVQAFARTSDVPVSLVGNYVRAGVGGARNRGVRESSAWGVAFCDADDRVTPGWLRGAHRGLLTAFAVGGPLRELRTPFDPDAPFLDRTSVVGGRLGPGVIGCNLAIRVKEFRACGGFDDRISQYGGEDSELFLRLHERSLSETGQSAPVIFSPEMCIYFRATEGRRARLRKVHLGLRAQYVIWHKHAEHFPQQQGWGFLVREALAAPVLAVRLFGAGQRNAAARALIAPVSHMAGERLVRRSYRRSAGANRIRGAQG